MAAITITHACMNKFDRSSAKYSHVYSFIPTDQLLRDTPHKYDVLLKPLIEELEFLFIEDEQVFFSKQIPKLSNEDPFPTLLAIPLQTLKPIMRYDLPLQVDIKAVGVATSWSLCS